MDDGRHVLVVHRLSSIVRSLWRRNPEGFEFRDTAPMTAGVIHQDSDLRRRDRGEEKDLHRFVIIYNITTRHCHPIIAIPQRRARPE
jgi:hypothetical protein